MYVRFNSGTRWGIGCREVIAGNNRWQYNGAFWRALPERYGPYAVSFNRLLRWQWSGVFNDLLVERFFNRIKHRRRLAT